MLAELVPDGHVCGVDHSLDMVELAKRVNKAHIRSGRVKIRQGSVLSLPYADDAFDVVTALETIQFWPDINEDLKEVNRVLKPQGELLIVNRCPDLEGRASSWADVLQIRSSDEYRERLSGAGYVDVSTDTTKHGWILAVAKKPQDMHARNDHHMGL